MKRKLLATLTILFTLLVCALNLPRLPDALRKTGGDFNMRYNEVQCVKEGINPYDIWSGKVPSTKYYGILLVAVASIAYGIGHRVSRIRSGAVFCAVSVFLLGPGLNSCFDTQNYGILAAGAIFAMALALRRRHDIVAGMAWAILMAKPQNGLLFAIPLVYFRKWRTIGVAIGICSLCTIPPALLTKTSPVDLIACLANIRSGDVMSTTLLPAPVFALLRSLVGQSATLAVSALAGGLTCMFLTRHAERFSNDPFVWLFPATLCSLAWTYKMPYDYCIMALPLLLIGLSMVQLGNQSCRRATMALLCAVTPFLWYVSPTTSIGRTLWRNVGVPITVSLSQIVSATVQFVELAAFVILCCWFAKEGVHTRTSEPA